jgi:hypothetical protein
VNRLLLLSLLQGEAPVNGVPKKLPSHRQNRAIPWQRIFVQEGVKGAELLRTAKEKAHSFVKQYRMQIGGVGVSLSKLEKCTLSKTGCLAELFIWLPKRIEEKGFGVWKI